jgi:hypothetical protein
MAAMSYHGATTVRENITTPVANPDTLRLKVPRGLQLAIRQAAGQRHTTPAEWARQVPLRKREAEGVRLCNGKPVYVRAT